jgi:hypothetical protein
MILKCFSIQQYKNCLTGSKVITNSVQLKSARECQVLVGADKEKT